MDETLPRLPDARKIAALLEALSTIERQTLGGGGHGRLLYRSQALTAHAAAVGQRGLAALGRVAVQKAVLAFATDFRWLVLAFHKSVWLARVPARLRQIFAVAREDSSEKGRVNSTQTDCSWREATPPSAVRSRNRLFSFCARPGSFPKPARGYNTSRSS